MSQIDYFRQFPLEAQRKIFHQLIQKGKNTTWGKKHHYASIRSIDDFKKQVPIQDYESLKPFIEEIIKGKQNVLWPSPITWFAKSSGTTSDKSKFIPVSKESLKDCHFAGGKDLLAIYYNEFPDAAIFAGKSLSIGGSTSVSQLNKKAKYADLSAIIIENLPSWADFVRTPDKSISLQADWEEKINQIAEIAIHENVTSFSGVPSWNLILLKKMLALTGKKNISEIWPNLEMYAHGGVNFEPYRQQYEKLIPSSKMIYLETYNASEGFFAIQDKLKDGQKENGEMLLMLNLGIFYEFLPMEEVEKENPQTLQLNEVELDKNYALVISTNAGLWRYLIGDTIKFTNLHPFRIKVTGRIKYYINVFGEELIEDNARNALKKTMQATKSNVVEYSVAPILPNEKGHGAHEWIIEFDAMPQNKSEFAKLLDKHLQEVNSDYEAKRFKNMALQPPVVHFVEKGFFYNVMKNKGKIGGQNKVPRLLNNRSFLEEALEFLR